MMGQPVLTVDSLKPLRLRLLATRGELARCHILMRTWQFFWLALGTCSTSCVHSLPSPMPTHGMADFRPGGVSPLRCGLALTAPCVQGLFTPFLFRRRLTPYGGLYGKRLPVHDSNIHFFLTPLYSRFCQVTSNKLLQNTTASGQLYALLKAARLTAHDADGTVAQNRYSPVFDKLPCSSRALRGFMRQPKALRSPPATVS